MYDFGALVKIQRKTMPNSDLVVSSLLDISDPASKFITASLKNRVRGMVHSANSVAT